MNKEQIADQIADEVYKSPSYSSRPGYESLRDAALRALEHYEARVRELEQINENWKRISNSDYSVIKENERLLELVIEADEYLDTNDLTSIGHGSILHKKLKALRGEEEV